MQKTFAPSLFRALARPAFAAALLGMSLAAPKPARAQTGPVTQDQYKRTLEILRKVIQKNNQLERDLNDLKRSGGAPQASRPADGAVDLNALGSGASVAATKSPHRSAGVAPTFKFYFDLNLLVRPGLSDSASGGDLGDVSFENFHSFVFVEVLPDSKLQFSFDLRPTPNYYELDYQLNDRLQLRFGKIWIPFDDLSPHNLFGGRVNVSSLRLPGVTDSYLPDIWADLGIGAKFTLLDTPAMAAEGHVYIVNGFGQTDSDESFTGDEGGTIYANFNSTQARDNNGDKALGARFHTKFWNQRIGLGISGYRGRYSNSSQQSASTSILGFDGQLRLGNFEFRTGYSTMRVSVPDATNPDFDVSHRTGYYGELGLKFGEMRQWKGLLRGGSVQLDDRLENALTDQTFVGGTLVWRPSLLEYSLSVSQDLKKLNVTPDPKTNKTIVLARLIIAL